MTGVLALLISLFTLWRTWLRDREAYLSVTARSMPSGTRGRVVVHNHGPGTAQDIVVRPGGFTLVQAPTGDLKIPVLVPGEAFEVVTYPISEMLFGKPAEVEWNDGRRARQSRKIPVSWSST